MAGMDAIETYSGVMLKGDESVTRGMLNQGR